MEDVDIDPFGDHESRIDEPTDEHISFRSGYPRKIINLGTRQRRARNIIRRRILKN